MIAFMAISRTINKEFFKKWSSEMAYILGFFAADGSMYKGQRGAYYVAFYSNDLEILEKIRLVLSSDHKIGIRKISKYCPNLRYVLQIGSKSIYSDLLRLGFISNKSKILKFPHIPNFYLRHFVRGYFDGDGNILFKNYFRKSRDKFKYYFATKFTSGSISFLKSLQSELQLYARIGKGSLFEGDRSFVLSYAMKDSRKLCAFMYNGVLNRLFLERKYLIFEKAVNTWSGSSAG